MVPTPHPAPHLPPHPLQPLRACRSGQRGIALLTALLLMLAILLTGIAAARTAIHGALAATHERDRMLALHGAMAALADAEQDIEGGADPASARAAALANADPAAFADACGGAAPYDGLCSHAAADSDIHVALADGDGPGVVFGAFTGARIPSGVGALAAQAPRYLIERMPSAPNALLYRITALGFGSAGTTQVALQAYYRKLLLDAAPPEPGPPGTPSPGTPSEPGAPSEPGPPVPPGEPATQNDPADPAAPPATPPAPDNPGTGAAPGAPGTPGGPGLRVGWREIGNWHDGVAAGSASAATAGR